MAIVRRSNEILRVNDTLVGHYLDIGYDVIDETGAVLLRAVPTDNTQLKAEFKKLSEEVTQLKDINNRLRKQLAEADAKIKELSSKKEPAKEKVVENEPVVEKPKRRRKSDD